jgi:signal transduction histidine kinase
VTRADPDRYARACHAVAELAAAVGEGRDATTVLARVCWYARTLTGARATAVLTAEADGGFLVRAAAGGAWRRGARVPGGTTLAAGAIRGRTPVAARLRGCRYRHEQALAAAGLRRVAYVPVPGYGSIAGVLGVGHRRGGCADPALLAPLAAVAGLVTVAVGERERLARELHDSVEQTLYGISLGAGTAGELLRHDPARARRPIAWIQETAVAGLTDLRGLLLRLRPEALVRNGLVPALVRLLETLHTLRGCRTTAELGPEPAASADTRLALYRVAQEAVQNAAKHAGARQVTLRLFTEAASVVLEVADDGRGFVPDNDFPGRLGLRSMRERAADAGGRLEIVSGTGLGTIVRAVLPVDVAPA